MATPQSKRSRGGADQIVGVSDDEELSTAHPSPQKGPAIDMDKLFADMRGELSTMVNEQASTTIRTVQTSVESLIGNYAKSVDASHAKLEASLKTLQAVQDKQLADQSDIQDRVKVLEQRLTLAERQEPDRTAYQDASFHRPVDPSVLRLNTTSSTSREKLLEGLQDLFREASLQAKDYQLEPGDEFARRFTITLTGAHDLASKRAGKILALLRNASGWRKFTTEASDGSETQIFIDKDKNPCMVKTEQSVKKLRAACAHKYPAKRFGINRDEGTVTVDWQLLFKLEYETSESPPIIKWHSETVTQHAIDRESVIEHFKSLEPRAANVQWCI